MSTQIANACADGKWAMSVPVQAPADPGEDRLGANRTLLASCA